MCKTKVRKTKIICLMFFLLLAAQVGITSAAERWWNAGGGTDTKWNVSANWYGNPAPTISDNAFLDRPDSSTLIDSTITARCLSLDVAKWSWNHYLYMTGGSLTVSQKMIISNLHHQWGYSQGQVYMSGGAVSVGGDLVICADGWWGLLEMTEGTINVGGTLWLPGGTDDAGVGAAFGELHLYNGTITAGNFDSNDHCGGRIFDIVTGQLIINGNDTADIAAGVNEGWITGYNGAVPVAYDYGVTNAGKTTVKATGCHWIRKGADNSWTTAANWVGGVPTSSKFAGIVAAGTTCEINSGVNAESNDCMIAYFSNWGGAGN